MIALVCCRISYEVTGSQIGGAVSVHKTTSDIKGLQVYIGLLETDIENLRSVVAALLEKAQIEPEEKERLAGLLVVTDKAVEEVMTTSVRHDKSIQQLLNESQSGNGK